MDARKIHRKTSLAKKIEVSAFLSGVELRELAAALGISRQAFYLRRIGAYRWREGEIEKIAEHLGVTVEFLRGEGAGDESR